MWCFTVLSVVLTMIHLDDSLYIFMVGKGAPMEGHGKELRFTKPVRPPISPII